MHKSTKHAYTEKFSSRRHRTTFKFAYAPHIANGKIEREHYTHISHSRTSDWRRQSNSHPSETKTNAFEFQLSFVYPTMRLRFFTSFFSSFIFLLFGSFWCAFVRRILIFSVRLQLHHTAWRSMRSAFGTHTYFQHWENRVHHEHIIIVRYYSFIILRSFWMQNTCICTIRDAQNYCRFYDENALCSLSLKCMSKMSRHMALSNDVIPTQWTNAHFHMTFSQRKSNMKLNSRQIMVF